MSVKIVKICFMLISLAGGTSFFRAGSHKRSQLQAKFRANKTHLQSLGPRLRFIKLSFPDHLRVRRGFRSYFYNYLDEIAMATCAAIPSNGPGLVYAVRRTCGEKPDCKHICTDKKLRHQGPKEVHNLTWDCTESIHVYKRQPALADNYDEYTDSHKLGLAVFRHHSCTVSGCGPNYCCCRAVTL